MRSFYKVFKRGSLVLFDASPTNERSVSQLRMRPIISSRCGIDFHGHLIRCFRRDAL